MFGFEQLVESEAMRFRSSSLYYTVLSCLSRYNAIRVGSRA
jgi:hypothetical protein